MIGYVYDSGPGFQPTHEEAAVLAARVVRYNRYMEIIREIIDGIARHLPQIERPKPFELVMDGEHPLVSWKIIDGHDGRSTYNVLADEGRLARIEDGCIVKRVEFEPVETMMDAGERGISYGDLHCLIRGLMQRNTFELPNHPDRYEQYRRELWPVSSSR